MWQKPKKNYSKKSIAELCCGCGTCYTVCPVGAISMEIISNRLVAVRDTKKCTKCGLCDKVCPFLNGDNNNKSLFGKYKSAYIASSNDKELLKNSSSGGVISVLLKNLLKKGYIDFAIAVGFKSKKPYLAKAVRISSSKEISKIYGTKYQQVDVNSELRNLRATDKFAVVGLPCHLKGLDLLLKQKKISSRNIVKIGLFCGHNSDLRILNYFFDRNRIDKSKIKSFSYRKDGWPGSLFVKNNDSSQKYDYKSYHAIFKSYFFSPKSCIFCQDLTSEYADISVGDAWGISNKKSSIVIIRNQKAEKLFNNLLNKKLIDAKKIDEGDIITSQGSQLFFKKKNIYARCMLYNLFHRNKIIFGKNIFRISLADYLGAALVFINQSASLRTVKIIPDIILKYYGKIVSYSTGFSVIRIRNLLRRSKK